MQKVFSIQIIQYFSQILPRVCTLVLFILLVDALLSMQPVIQFNFHTIVFTYGKQKCFQPKVTIFQSYYAKGLHFSVSHFLGNKEYICGNSQEDGCRKRLNTCDCNENNRYVHYYLLYSTKHTLSKQPLESFRYLMRIYHNSASTHINLPLIALSHY